MRRVFLAIALLLPSVAAAQDVGARLLADARIKDALTFAQADEPRTIADQIRLCEVPAPPFMEAARATVYADDFRALGLRNVRIDAEGNVLGERPGRTARPHLVISAHLDTVFPEGTDVSVTREGSVLRGPGIGDDCRGLAVMLAVVRALDKAAIQTEGPMTFVGTVGEEGLGDLRGVKRLFNETLKGQVDRFISIDGDEMAITNRAVGSLRYRVTFSGPGGHSFNDFGMANPVHALGRAIAAVSQFEVPADPKTTFSVGRIGGGTSVNAIPRDAWLEVDLRSAESGTLKALAGRFDAAVDRALADENARWSGGGQLSLKKDIVGDRPPGATSETDAIVTRALSVTRALGATVVPGEASTDANYPMSLGIPAITVGAGGVGVNAHSPAETFDTADSWKGTQRTVLLAIALTDP
jgi:acetylornithine deacetylase/succinyl-diaminopimelate desuccinylase-like protein